MSEGRAAAARVRCDVSSADPFTALLRPDQPLYGPCELVVDYTDALLQDLGPSLLMLYASMAGPPVTRDALVEMVQPVVALPCTGGSRDALLQAARGAYAPVLARARERVDQLA